MMKTTYADIVIIGSGVAGTAVATTILQSNANASIVMLEAGSKEKLKDFGRFQNYLLTNKLPSDHRNIYDAHQDLPFRERDRAGENISVGHTTSTLTGARLFVYGGSTTHWGGWAFRLKPEDFTLHSLTGRGMDWPITYGDLEKFYGKAERFLGVSGDATSVEDSKQYFTDPYPYQAFPFTREDGLVIRAFKKLGIKYSNLPVARNGVPLTSGTHAPCQTTGTCKYCPFGARFAAANHLDDMRSLNSYPNFTVFENSIVRQIILSTNTKVRGITVYDRATDKEYEINARHVIVASGTIESTKLLMRSKATSWPAGLGNQHGHLGRHFVTHPYFSFQAAVPDGTEKFYRQMGFPTLVTRHFDVPEEQRNGKFILLHPADSPFSTSTALMQQGLSREDILKKMKEGLTFRLQGMIEVFSDYGNTIEPMESINRFGLPETKINFSQSNDFSSRMTSIKAHVTEIFRAMGSTGKVEEDQISWRADHAACTTRMSNNEIHGVVNKDLKVHGLDNLYVCSNSTFPSFGAVNPTLTLTALSLRLGEHLNEII